MPRKVILDVDTGIDDALALLLALASPEIELIGVTCVAGNTTIENVVPNTLGVLHLGGHTDVPVAVGARKPLVARLHTASYFHGHNGLADLHLSSPQQPIAEDAVSFLVRSAAHAPGEITLVAVGPLTNVALAILRDASFAGNLRQLIVMGGAIGTVGNATGAAEANFRNDPGAAEVVVTTARPWLVDLAATHQTVLPMDTLPSMDSEGLSPVAHFVLQLLHFYARAYQATGLAGPVLHDPLALALAADPSLAAAVPLFAQVETSGGLTRGATVASFSPLVGVLESVDDRWDVVGMRERPFNATVARHIQVERFLHLVRERLGLVP